MIVVLAFCSGTILSFDQPARSSLVPILVPHEDLMNAISLQAIVFNGSAFIGPTIAGLSLGLFDLLGKQVGLPGNHLGYAGNFFLNGISFFGVLFVLYRLRLPEGAVQASTERRGPLLSSIRASLEVVKRDAILPWVLSGYGALLFFGPSTSLILPIFARQILHLTAFELGLLFSASGLGIILGAVLIASLGDIKYKGTLLLISFLLWSGALIVFALSRTLWLSTLALLLLGIAQNGVSTPTMTLMQTRVPPQMRGRVMSLNSLLVMGLRPLGDFPASALMSLIGGPFTVLISAAIVGFYTLYLLVARPIMRSL
jgi:MFS family permease